MKSIQYFFRNMRYLIFTILFFFATGLTAQEDAPTSRKAARGFLNYNNYRQALEEYFRLYEKDSTNIEYNYSIGLCYLETYIDKSKAIPYLEWVTEQPKANPVAWYDLGRAYAINYRFDDAMNAFMKFQQSAGKDDNYIPAARWIEMCQNAHGLMQHPVNVTFSNMGGDINSNAPDFNPYVTADETFLVFSTKRAGNTGGWSDYDGFLTSDVMFSTAKGGKWQKPKRMPNSINTAIVEESVGMSPDGSHLFVYLDNFTASGDVYLAEKTGRSFTKLEPLGKNINTRYLETSACIAPNKKIIFFAASYPDSYGGTDIYYSKKLPNGEWGVPVNAGNTINTSYDDEFPSLAPDGQTLYFASTGHNSMGGFDVFRTTWNKDNMTFSVPENIGYPLNTPDNNFTISFTKSGRFAYISAFRPDGYGDLDIYRITFQDVTPPLHTISGRILNPDSSNVFSDYMTVAKEFLNLKYINDSVSAIISPMDSLLLDRALPGGLKRWKELSLIAASKPHVLITVTDFQSGETTGVYRPNPRTGKFIMILPPGKYSVLFETAGYISRKTELHLHDYESIREDISLDVLLFKE
jgi:hypothetical protein